jgi:hypothetical protein
MKPELITLGNWSFTCRPPTEIRPMKPELTKQEMMEAITLGVYRAFWQMITNATDMPCDDFYAAVQNGVQKAMSEINHDRH